MRALAGTAAGKVLIVAAGAALVAAVVVAVLLLRAGQTEPASSFPPWYPMADAAYGYALNSVPLGHRNEVPGG